MAAEDKFNKATGKAKETAGKATGDSRMERRGQAEQAKSSLKEAAEKLRGIFKR